MSLIKSYVLHVITDLCLDNGNWLRDWQIRVSSSQALLCSAFEYRRVCLCI